MAPITASPSPSTSTSAARAGMPRPASALDPADPLPAVLDLVEAAALLGVGRTTAYRLVHDGQWPTPVLRLGRLGAGLAKLASTAGGAGPGPAL